MSPISSPLFRVASVSSLALFCCGPSPSEVPPGGTEIVIFRDAASWVPSFACDAAASDEGPTVLVDARPESGGCTAGNPNVSFRDDVLPVFEGCSGELCHAPWSYDTTVGITSTECCDRRKIVDPGNPGTSYLLQKIRGIDLCGNSIKMGDVTPLVATAIEDWICIGAPDN